MAGVASVPVLGGGRADLAAAHVPLALIDQADTTFLVRHELGHEELAKSIAREGILVPVWLARRSGRLAVCDGFRRLFAARACRLEEIPAIVWSGVLDGRLWRMVLTEKAAQGNLDLFERALLFDKLRACGDADAGELAGDGARALGFPVDPRRVAEILAVLEVPGPTRARLLELGIAPRAVLAYAHQLRGREEAFFFSRYLRLLGFTSTELAEFLDALETLRRTQERPILELLASFQPKADDRADGKAAVGRLLRALREATQPTLQRARARVAEVRKRLRLPKGVALEVPASFERPGFQLTLDLESRGDWQAKKAWLDEKAAEIEGMFDALP